MIVSRLQGGRAMKLYVFASKNITNIWAGIGAKLWAVSTTVTSPTMKGRETKAKSIRVGQFGIFYLSARRSLTTPFIFTSKPDTEKRITNVWSEEWMMPFSIYPLGTPTKLWNADDAAMKLPFNKVKRKFNLTSVFNLTGVQVFSPIEISEDDWEMIIKRLSDL
jgi:hypothetical protein